MKLPPLLLLALTLACSSAYPSPATYPAGLDPRAAAAYSARFSGDAVLVMQRGEVIFGQGQNGFSLETPHVLFSGTKSFSCALAISGVQDGLLELDEAVSRTITEWKTDPRKSRITVRQLLNLTSGLEGGKNGPVPSYAEALEVPTFAEPGQAFRYGPNPFQVFGELMRRKLSADPLTYLKRTVLDRIGLKVARWTSGPDGNPRFPQGAFLTAGEWVKYGQLIIQGGVWQGKVVLEKALLEQCFRPSSANPDYGLTFWLSPDPDATLGQNEDPDASRRSRLPLASPGARSSPPTRVLLAAGAGQQRLYLLPDLEVVVVRFGRPNAAYSDAVFLEHLLGP